MGLPVMPRWLAPVLVVVFLLLSAWSAYNLAVVSASSTPGTSAPSVGVTATGAYVYSAALRPNTLFNATNVSGTNLTLFVPITEWINVTIATSVVIAAPAAAVLSDRFGVVVSTPAWSKTIVERSQENSSSSTTGLTVVDRYALNVSAIEALVQRINAQLNYSAPQFTVTLAASVEGSVAHDGSILPFDVGPWLNLTFEDPLIVPYGVPASWHGAVDPVAGAGSPDRGALSIAWTELAACLGALALSVWLFWSGRRSPGPAPLPSLERLIEPYEEVIARTTSGPAGARMMPVERWEDLVKVADTLGRPILRPTPGPGDPVGSEFFVYDGTVAYVYRYPRTPATGGPARPEPAAPAAPPPRAPPSAPAKAAVPGAPPRRRASPGIAAQLEIELQRLRSVPLDPAQRWYAFSVFTQTVRTVGSAGPAEAQRAVDELRATLDRLLGPATRRPPPS